MEHAMVKDETGTPFCLCGFQPPPGPEGPWQAKRDVLNHITDKRNHLEPQPADRPANGDPRPPSS